MGRGEGCWDAWRGACRTDWQRRSWLASRTVMACFASFTARSCACRRGRVRTNPDRQTENHKGTRTMGTRTRV